MNDSEFRDMMRVSASDGCAEVARKRSFEMNARWARNVVNANPHKSGSFIFGAAGAYLLADDDNRIILNASFTLLRTKYPTWDIEERQP